LRVLLLLLLLLRRQWELVLLLIRRRGVARQRTSVRLRARVIGIGVVGVLGVLLVLLRVVALLLTVLVGWLILMLVRVVMALKNIDFHHFPLGVILALLASVSPHHRCGVTQPTVGMNE